MAYIWREELSEGETEADVVTREDYDLVINERDELITERDALVGQRDDLLNRAETAEANYRDAQNKYADAFITSAARAKADQVDDVKRDGKIQSFEELFGTRGVYGAY